MKTALNEAIAAADLCGCCFELIISKVLFLKSLLVLVLLLFLVYSCSYVSLWEGFQQNKKRQIIHFWWICVYNIHIKEISLNRPLGRFSQRVAMSVHGLVELSV